MSTNVAYAGFSLKLNEDYQSENGLKEIAMLLGYEWKDNWEWDDIMYEREKYLNRWKPHMDIDGVYGFIWVTQYEYDAVDIEYKQPIGAMDKALKTFIEQTKIMPEEEICAIAQIYYNGSDDPFKF